MHAHGDVLGLALVDDLARQGRGDGAGEADVLGDGPGLRQLRNDDRGDDDEEHGHGARPQALGTQPFTQLPARDQPGLPETGPVRHAATARRNNSDSVGG